MYKPAVAGACVRCARPSLTLLALRNTQRGPGRGSLRGSCSECAPVEAYLRSDVVQHVGGHGSYYGDGFGIGVSSYRPPPVFCLRSKDVDQQISTIQSASTGS